jgi:hypothetical protein
MNGTKLRAASAVQAAFFGDGFDLKEFVQIIVVYRLLVFSFIVDKPNAI